jgi:hypothetical protein
MIARTGANIYFGDNDSIDGAAAIEAKIRYLLVGRITQEFMNTKQGLTLANIRGGLVSPLSAN